MNAIKIMVNGLPGSMATNIVRHALEDTRFEVLPFSLTGPEITQSSCDVDRKTFTLVHPDQKDAAIVEIKNGSDAFISTDYTHPAAVNLNAEFYCRNGLPFVMGTTGGDRAMLEETVRASDICAVISPNMAKQIVGFQAMMAYASEMFPKLFEGYTLEIRESHQKGKADTSGTAKAMVNYFNALGIPFAEQDIFKERDPERQHKVWGVPHRFVAGHGYHTYTLVSKDQTVTFQFSHNVNGRDVYVQGTLDAVQYLHKKIAQSERATIFSMIDVLKDA